MEKYKSYNINIDGKVQINLKFLDRTEDYFIFEKPNGDRIVVESYRVCSFYTEDDKKFTCGELMDKLKIYSNQKVRIAIDNGHGMELSTRFGSELQLQKSPSGITIRVAELADVYEEDY